MTSLLNAFTSLRRRREADTTKKPARSSASRVIMPSVDIAPDDPLVEYLVGAPEPVELKQLHLDTPAVRGLREAGVTLIIPLVSQGELMGLLNLGPRLSEQEYSRDDRRLLSDLATQAAPAVRVAQLVREQKSQERERERIEQELRIARIIQQTLLPKELPDLPGWRVDAYYQPARAVGGDFYDFITLDDGRMALVVGDVTDKGVPAALVMATTRSILRSAAQSQTSPGEVLERANDLLHPDIPPKMFVTCFYAVLDPRTGRLAYANAGHDLPYHRRGENVVELRATGMPLGLMPGMRYEERETSLAPGDSVLFYSDGLVEAHNIEREMFSFGRLMEFLGAKANGDDSLVERVLAELAAFTGAGWEQEDDVTLVTLERAERPHDDASHAGSSPAHLASDEHWSSIDSFTVPSAPGNERLAISLLENALREITIAPRPLERLKTAVGEATMNAMEHGNNYHAELPVEVEALLSGGRVMVRITDRGGAPMHEPELPDIEAKLAQEQTPRGWGLFLIKNLVDEMRVTSDGTRHTVELIVSREGENHASASL
ncbi:MAG TPA: SpoIIE family protein phosphatase [Ktedonobacterales bacterium]|nr:SpoIIE family protein phosphatase [Ktedonobacterales bacterium]